MISTDLTPRLEFLSQEYVLIQAWKKTSSHIRLHNWHADTLELDRATANLRAFLRDIATRVNDRKQWRSDPLRLVPAPKSQRWEVDPTGRWKIATDVEGGPATLRPLAHVSLRDQVLACAIMLCLANRVETMQGDPRKATDSRLRRREVVSYGNRLVCHTNEPQDHRKRLAHQWGSRKLYRSYFQDYRKFLARPEFVAETTRRSSKYKIVLIQSDLRQFYDRVRPVELSRCIRGLQRNHDEQAFFDLASIFLNWRWHVDDITDALDYGRESDIPNFGRVSLPQGLVAAGFFANVALLGLDAVFRASIGKEIASGVFLEDACRYVDDLRIVVGTKRVAFDVSDVQLSVIRWLEGVLRREAPGQAISKDKTRASIFRGDERPLVIQSRKMERIQNAVSGGFGVAGGIEILDAVGGLMQSQRAYSQSGAMRVEGPLSPVPDVRDATVARFSAGRFRSTYRSLRPLLDHERPSPASVEQEDEEILSATQKRTREELDDDAKAFAYGLVEQWTDDPSNVRLLLIGLDIWPSVELLRIVLNLIKPYLEYSRATTSGHLVTWYCLSEVFRAGAVETGIVADDESLPSAVDIVAYRALLCAEALRLLNSRRWRFPWYLRQQALLYLAVASPKPVRVMSAWASPETEKYCSLLRFLGGRAVPSSGVEFAILSIIARRSFLDRKAAIEVVSSWLDKDRLARIARRDPAFALELVNEQQSLASELSARIRRDLCILDDGALDGEVSLASLVLDPRQNGPLRNELGLLKLAYEILPLLSAKDSPRVITPSDVIITRGPHASDFGVKVKFDDDVPVLSMYRPPGWAPRHEWWRFQLGYLLRFVLCENADFTTVAHPDHRAERRNSYRPTESLWFQRRYSMFNEQSAFGNDWLPISQWTENLLFALLSWPGCALSETIQTVLRGSRSTRKMIGERIDALQRLQGVNGQPLLLPLAAPNPDKRHLERPLRACIMQTVVPSPKDFKLDDMELNKKPIRTRHRRHLSAALEAVDRMLILRETHHKRHGLDWLILPELSVHPRDVRTHLIPFARRHKAIVLAGLTYERLNPDEPLINSALWVIPSVSPSGGFKVITRRQGKRYLAPMEEDYFNRRSTEVSGFRPCQWLIEYEWSAESQVSQPLRLSAAVCYDATDLQLATLLRDHSDVFAIPALNVDVSTFDQMAEALHYHMFQMVVVANNGTYGGSNAYAPYALAYERQVFHMHGQPQATVCFLEIDSIGQFLSRKVDAKAKKGKAESNSSDKRLWKYPPAGM